MDQNLSLTQNVDTLFSNLESFTQKEGLMGKPISHGDKTFIPVLSVTLGYGTGNSSGKSQQGNSSGNQNAGMTMGNMGMGALGLGARLNTDAVIVIDKDNVSMMTIGAAGNMSHIMDKIPQALMGMNQNKQQGQQNTDQNQQQNNQQ